MAVARHVRVISEKIASAEVKTADLADLAVTRPKIGATAVTAGKAGIRFETGTGSPGYTAGYKTLGTVFGTPPAVALYSQMAGKLTDIAVGRVRPGSFTWFGSPAGQARYFAFGFLKP